MKKTIFAVLIVCMAWGYSQVIAAGYPPVCFISTHVGWGWVFNHSGWFIDSTGTQRVFKYRLQDSVWTFNQDSIYTDEEFARMTALADTAIGAVPDSELSYMTGLVKKAANGPFTDRVHVCADAGNFYYGAYYYDPSKKGYREVVLYASGDIAWCNLSAEAKQLVTWLYSKEPDSPAAYCESADCKLGDITSIDLPSISYTWNIPPPLGGKEYTILGRPLAPGVDHSGLVISAEGILKLRIKGKKGP